MSTGKTGKGNRNDLSFLKISFGAALDEKKRIDAA
jgi:hypothetical protein